MNALIVTKEITLDVEDVINAAGSGCELDLLKEIVQAIENDDVERALTEWLIERCDVTVPADRAFVDRLKELIARAG